MSTARAMLGGKRMVRAHVLVVDDDEALREALAESLRDGGFDVRCVADGREALDAMRAAPRPGLVLLDLMMPGLSGWQVLELMAREDALRDLPVVVLTAFEERADLPNGRPVLHKPFDDEVLRDLVERAMAA